MDWPQIVLPIWWGLCLVFCLIKNGKSMGSYNFANDLFRIGVYIYILWVGGFWK
jgi:hypothetical protein